MQADEKLRGRTALEREHQGLWGHDEPRFDYKISAIYGVDLEEARDIHTDYHLERLLRRLEERLMSHGTPAVSNEDLAALDADVVALQVASGALTEAGAVDLLWKKLTFPRDQERKDRYINFYS